MGFEQPRRICGSTRVVGTKDSFRLEVAACELAHEQLGGAGAEARLFTATLVKAGSVCLASSMSSKPITAKSPPTETPASVRARMSPIATTSLKQRAAVAAHGGEAAAEPPPRRPNSWSLFR